MEVDGLEGDVHFFGSLLYFPYLLCPTIPNAFSCAVSKKKNSKPLHSHGGRIGFVVFFFFFYYCCPWNGCFFFFFFFFFVPGQPSYSPINQNLPPKQKKREKVGCT